MAVRRLGRPHGGANARLAGSPGGTLTPCPTGIPHWTRSSGCRRTLASTSLRVKPPGAKTSVARPGGVRGRRARAASAGSSAGLRSHSAWGRTSPTTRRHELPQRQTTARAAMTGVHQARHGAEVAYQLVRLSRTEHGTRCRPTSKSSSELSPPDTHIPCGPAHCSTPGSPRARWWTPVFCIFRISRGIRTRRKTTHI